MGAISVLYCDIRCYIGLSIEKIINQYHRLQRQSISEKFVVERLVL